MPKGASMTRPCYIHWLWITNWGSGSHTEGFKVKSHIKVQFQRGIIARFNAKGSDFKGVNQKRSTTIDELTLAETLIKIKAVKPKTVTVVTTTATTVTTVVDTRPKAKGIFMQEPSEKPSQTTKDQVALDEQMARELAAQLQAEIAEEERLRKLKEEEANIALIESWENTQAMMEDDRLLHKKREADLPKGQKRNQMCTYLKHMGGYKHKQLKGRSYEEIQKLFNKEMKRVNSFVAMGFEAQESSGKKNESSSKKAETIQESSTKRARDELEPENSKKQKAHEHEEVEEEYEAEVKKHLEIVKEDDMPINAIPLATKPPMIVEYKIIKEGIFGHFQMIRVDGSSKRYSSMIVML
ncbi:hypothetical protein Tco_0613845 [Tanacetum coccineum]